MAKITGYPVLDRYRYDVETKQNSFYVEQTLHGEGRSECKNDGIPKFLYYQDPITGELLVKETLLL